MIPPKLKDNKNLGVLRNLESSDVSGKSHFQGRKGENKQEQIDT
jgi:hypothetical protein